MPHDHDSEFNGQQPQYPQAVNENAAMGVNNGFDAWGNPQFQQPYQNAAFVPVPYPQQHGQPQHYQHPHNAPQQIQPQPQPQNLNYQFQSYDPSFDQRPLQPSPQNSIDAPGYMLQTMQQPVHQPVHQHQYVQQTDWQHMPPPMPIPSPSYQAHQTIPSQVTPPVTPQITPQPQYQYQQQHQHQLSMPQHANSPIASLSPQLPPQFLPNPNNRHAGAGMRMENASRVSASPRLTSQGIARSPSIGSARSPAPTPGLLPHHADTNSLLICLAEEFFAKARTASLSMWDNIDAQSLHEYQKLIATGLGCLEVVLDNTKLPPRLEAKVRFRYASILCAETNNVMEAETALTKGITLCDRVMTTCPLAAYRLRSYADRCLRIDLTT